MNDNNKIMKGGNLTDIVARPTGSTKTANNDNIFIESEIKQINELIDTYNKTKNMELEVGFKNINYAIYMHLLETLTTNFSEKDITTSITLDVIITTIDNDVFRFTLTDTDYINEFISSYERAGKTQLINILEN